MSDLTDQELIDRSLAGEPDAFDALVLRHQDRLVHSLKLACGSFEEAQEAAQLAFVSAWKNLSGFRQDSAFYSWLYRIAMNAARTAGRKKRISTTSLDQLHNFDRTEAEDMNPDVQPDHAINREERSLSIQAALQEIAEEFRQPLILREIDEMSYDEIASILEIPVGTVRSRIFRARQELTARLRRLFPDEFPSHAIRERD